MFKLPLFYTIDMRDYNIHFSGYADFRALMVE